MNPRQLALVGEVDKFWAEAIGTHWATCYLYHTDCLVAQLMALEEEGEDA